MGIDLNKAMLAVARAKSDTIEWVEGSVLDLPFESKTFDLVLCQLGLQFFPDRLLALKEMVRVLKPRGRAAFSVYSAIERTPAAHAFVQALDKFLGTASSQTKRSEHLACKAGDLETLALQAGFDAANATAVTQKISFPSMLDYVRFQLMATPMAILLKEKDALAREQLIEAIAADAAMRLDPSMLQGGELTSPQEAFVVTASRR